MKSLTARVLAAGLVLASGNVVAGPHGDQLAKCITEKTTKEDRAALINWMFAALAMNPALEKLAKISDEERLSINKAGGAMFQKALAEVCLEEAKATSRIEGSDAVGAAFGALGELAMEEMFSDPAVNSELEKLITFVDLNKLVPIFAQPEPAPADEPKE